MMACFLPAVMGILCRSSGREGRRSVMTGITLSRRKLAAGGAAALALPYIWPRPARAAGQVVVRNPGGAYSDTQKKYVYEPFTKETGIEVVVVPSTMAK